MIVPTVELVDVTQPGVAFVTSNGEMLVITALATLLPIV